MLTALISDDEPLARAHLRRLLESQQIEVVGEAENAIECLQQAEDLRPELLFLDIQMPGLTGMQVASALLQLEHAPLIIFVTGYSEFAVPAFEVNALDYLVKPVAPDRLARTLLRARSRVSDKTLRQRVQSHVAEQVRESAPIQRLPVREDYVVRLLRVEEIICAVSREKRVMVRTPTGEHRTYYTLTNLESLLPAERFLRIHDSCIVNIDRVDKVIFLGNHSYAVQLSDGSQLPVSRSRYGDLQRRMGLDMETAS